MNKQKSKSFLIVLAFLAAVAGCKPVQLVHQEMPLSMPDRYLGNAPTDSSGIGRMDWHAFFTDPQLINLIDTVLAGNFDLRIAATRVLQARSGVLTSKADLLPKVDLAANAEATKFGRYTTDGAGNSETNIYGDTRTPEVLPDYFVGFQAGWELDLWRKLGNRKKAAAARFLVSMEGKNLVQTGLVASVAEAYFTLQSLDARLAVLDEYINLQQNALDLVRAQKASGAANELAVKQFEARLLDLRAMRINAEQSIVENENLINFLAGRFPQPVARTPLFLDLGLPVALQTGVPSQLLENRPDIRAAAAELAASKADLAAARAQFYPSLNIGAALGMQAFRPELLVSTPQSLTFNLLGELAAPLINRKAIRAEFNRADAYQQEALLNYQQSIVNGYVEVYNELNAMRQLSRQFELRAEQSGALGKAVDISGDLFRTGRANYLEVLNAQQNALETRLELVDLRREQWRAAVGLYRAMGGGWR